MEFSLIILIPIALALVAFAIKLFFWAVNNGQYDDLDAEASRILFDDDVAAKQSDTPRQPDQSAQVDQSAPVDQSPPSNGSR